MRVLVTGGAGYIGSVITDELVDRGHIVSVLDNLSKGHRDAVHAEARLLEVDLLNADAVRASLQGARIEAVIHMAASSLVGDSMTAPAHYYRNNVVASLALLDAMLAAGSRILVFSSTAAVYGEPEKQPIGENDRAIPSNTYGATKLAIEQALHWYRMAYGFRYASLRYFNAAGATSLRGERHTPETHLIPLVLDAAQRGCPVTVFGDDYETPDGTCVRDYIHVADLARAHVLALEALASDKISGGIFNLGTGRGYSVREVLTAAREITGANLPEQIGPRRPGDPPRLVAESTRVREELGWAPAYSSIEIMIDTAWNWKQGNATLLPDAQLRSLRRVHHAKA